jgi:predicted SAM-dependent methyltransferase
MKRKLKMLNICKFLQWGKYNKQPSKNNAINNRRELITNLFIKGDGIEIGALHNPLIIPKTAKVKYVDRMTVPDLRKHYPELNSSGLVNVDIICNGEKLENVENNSQDFVVANHFLEHCQNPLLALKNILRVIKIGGVAYIAVPDKRYTFDIDRPVTQFEHIEKDYFEGPENSREAHFKEWVEYVNKIEDAEVKKNRIIELMNIDYSIHFHVWTQRELLDFLSKARNYFFFDVEMFHKNGHEIIVILSKTN